MWRHVIWQKFTDVSEERTASIFGADEYAKYIEGRKLKMEAVRSSETSVNFYKTT
jgi:hypothetical protein